MSTFLRHQTHLLLKIRPSCFSTRYLPLSSQKCIKETETGTSDLKINGNVRIFQNSILSSSPPPLVLLFGWVSAKPKYLKKYTDIYIRQGFDVICVQLFLKQLLIPRCTVNLVRDAADILKHSKRKNQQILVHALCSGCHVYGLFLANLEEHPYKYGEIGRHLRGQILESIVQFDKVPVAMARSGSRKRYISNMIEPMITWFFARFPSAVSDFKKSSDTNHLNRLQLPSLFLFSTKDSICSPKHFEEVATKWRSSGVNAALHTWDDAEHLGIYKKHKDEYEKIILDFIRTTGVKDKQS